MAPLRNVTVTAAASLRMFRAGSLMRGGIAGNARSLRLQQLRLRRRNDIIMMAPLRNVTVTRNDIIMAPLRNVTVTAVASLRNITLTTVAPLRKIAVTVTTVASLRKSLLRESGHSLESFLRSAATARIATATTATAKSRRAPKWCLYTWPKVIWCQYPWTGWKKTMYICIIYMFISI